MTTKAKVAHARLCHSRMFFVRAYARETQEMVFGAHDLAFRPFQGACRRRIYDNMKTVVETVFIGENRAFNRRFLQMCGHYLIEPTACAPGAAWAPCVGCRDGRPRAVSAAHFVTAAYR